MSEADHPTTSAMAPGTLTALLREVAASPVDAEAPLPVLRPGQAVGRFELVREIGRGGFGVVYEAADRELGRSVALKAVRRGGNLALKQERLLREAEAAAQLSHPNIVTLHDMGRSEHGPYLVMELLRGSSLAERLALGALPAHEAVGIAIDVARALAHAHAHAVLHRDLTPGNVFVCRDGRVKVLDFGMAQAFGRPKVDGGTRPYMAPEQWTGAAEDERTDLFALGVILHQMLSGRLPFPDARDLETGPAPRLGAAGAGVPAELVARMLAPRPEDRPRSAQEVLEELAAAHGAPGTLPPVRRGSSRTSRLGAVIAAAVVAALGAGLVHRVGGGSPVPPPRPAVREASPERPAPPAPEVPASAPAIPVRASPARPRPPARPSVTCRDSINAVPTPAPASGHGVLTIEADPFAEVWLDGRRRGETPAECRVPGGVHVVRVVHPRYGAREARVVVAAGERARFTTDFLSGP